MSPPVRPAEPGEAELLVDFHRATWGGTVVVGHDTVYDLTALPTLVATDPDDEVAGALTYHLDGDGLEIVSIQVATSQSGYGTALLDAAVDVARLAGARRVWLVTTNDNLDALRFYQRRGMRITRVDPGAVDRARQRKPTIPRVGLHGIPVRDELTLELRLEP